MKRQLTLALASSKAAIVTLFLAMLFALPCEVAIGQEAAALVAATPLRDRACEILKKLKSKRGVTILVAKVKEDGKEKIYVTANPGSGPSYPTWPAGNDCIPDDRKPGDTIRVGDWQKICEKIKADVAALPVDPDDTPEEAEKKKQDEIEKRKKAKKEALDINGDKNHGGWPGEKVCKDTIDGGIPLTDLIKKKLGDKKLPNECVLWMTEVVEDGKKKCKLDYSCFKRDWCTSDPKCVWPHAEDTLEKHCKKLTAAGKEVEICGIGIATGPNSKPNMCDKCFKKFRPDKDDSKWPKPEGQSDEDFECQKIRCGLVENPPPKKKKVKVQKITRDTGLALEECNRLYDIEMLLDSKVEVVGPGITVRQVGEPQPLVLPTCLAAEYSFSVSLPEDLPPGEYEVKIYGNDFVDVVSACEVELEGPDVVDNVLTYIEVKAVPGDINQDMAVNFTDFLEFAAEFMTQPTEPSWDDGDFNNNGETDFVDFLQLIANYGTEY